MTDAAIVCEKLCKQYNGAPPTLADNRGPHTPGGRGNGSGFAVDHLDLKVEPGEFLGLLGPNGAGKTTLIGMLTTRVMPTKGKAFVVGVDVEAQPARARARIAVVTQANTLDSGLSVFDNLYYHGRYFGLTRADSRKQAGDLLDRFDLKSKANARIEELSGGLARQVLIARALLHRPEVLFLDEPTSGLDPQSRLRLREELAARNSAGQTIVLATHDMKEAEQLCKRIAIIHCGRRLADDTPKSLKTKIQARRLLKLTLAACDCGRLLAIFEKIPGVVNATYTGNIVQVQADGTPGLEMALMNAISQAGCELSDFSVSEPSLEEVYLELTGKADRT
jgi:ABC-2 type transport system ATP-binding protein